MNTLTVLRHGAFVLLAWLALTGAASAQLAAPTVSAVVNGSYTVSYPPNCDSLLSPELHCEFVYLVEKTEPNGQWTVVSEGTGSIAYSSKAPGSYSYMLWVGAYDAWYIFHEGYSPVTTVTVASAQAAPVRENVLDQLNYNYDVRRGDFNYDGRTDLFVRKVAGGMPLNGTVEQLILRQDSYGNFAPVVPTPDQALLAASWAPAPTIGVRLHDIDVDGFVDLTLANVSSVVGGAADQIVYSPGQLGLAQPGGVRRVDSSLAQFVGNAMDFLYDPDYFSRNAPLYLYHVSIWYAWCPLYDYWGMETYDSQPFAYCYINHIYYYGYFFDYSAFHPDAVSLWATEWQAQNGQITQEQAANAIRTIVEGIIQSQIGGWPMEEVLGQTATDIGEALRRALEAAQAILSAARAIPEHVDMDNLPPQTPRERDVIHVTGHRLFPTYKGHLALEYSRPLSVNGLYVPTTLSGEAEHWPPVACLPGMFDLSFCGWGKLLAETNRRSDHWYMNFRVGHVIPLVGTPGTYWDNSLVPRHDRYVSLPYASKANYSALPDAANNTYNSNGYIRGLNGQGSLFVVPLDMTSVYPGWDRPVPNAMFE